MQGWKIRIQELFPQKPAYKVSPEETELGIILFIRRLSDLFKRVGRNK